MNHNFSPPQQKKTNISIFVFLLNGAIENLFKRYIISFPIFLSEYIFSYKRPVTFLREYKFRRYEVTFENNG